MNENTRRLGLFSAIAMMTGCVVGASVFIVPGNLCGSVGPGAWIAYVVGGILMFFNCFIYAQVGAIAPVSGANYMLCSRCVNGTFGFIYVWGFILANIWLLPIMSKTTAQYLGVFFPGITDHAVTVAIIVLLVTFGINFLGVATASWVQNACVIIIIAVILIFSLGGVTHADWSNFSPALPNGVYSVLIGAISTYYAFAGVNCIIELSGDIRNPGKNIPRTMFISFGIVVIMYIGMCIGLVSLRPAAELAEMATPAVTAAEGVFPGFFRYFIALAAIAASWTTLNAVVGSMAKLIMMLGKTGVLPKVFEKQNKRGACTTALIVLGVAGVVMVLTSASIMQFVNISSFYLLFISLLVAVASLQIKKKMEQEYEEAAYKLKGIWYVVWPVLSIVSGAAFMILAFRDDPKMMGLGVVMLPVGIILYLIRKKSAAAKGLDLDKEITKNM